MNRATTSTPFAIVILILAAACASPASQPTTDAAPPASASTVSAGASAATTPEASASPAPPCDEGLPSASSAADPSASAAPLAEGPLEPGRYTTTRFEPQIALTLGAGWRELFEDDSDEVALESDSGFLAITRVTRVVDPETGRAEDAPEDLFGWLLEHDALAVECTTAVTVGGLPGMMLEATVARGADIFAYAEGNMRVVSGQGMRYYVLSLEGPELTIVAASGDLDALIANVQPAIDSLAVVE
jgi:hypothetical protein